MTLDICGTADAAYITLMSYKNHPIRLCMLLPIAVDPNCFLQRSFFLRLWVFTSSDIARQNGITLWTHHRSRTTHAAFLPSRMLNAWNQLREQNGSFENQMQSGGSYLIIGREETEIFVNQLF